MRRGNENTIALLLRTSALATAAATLAGPAMAQDYGVITDGPDPLVVTNPSGTTIQGSKSGVFGRRGAVVVTNEGTIRGDGTYDGFDAAPDGGITIAEAGSSVANSGLISGARFGITTAYYFNPATGLLEPRAVGTTVTNLASGSIIGEGDDGVRLIGGGTVTNAGTIEGRVFIRADGVSMFAYDGQNTSGQTGIGTVTNQTGGTIFGARFGVGLSGGGTVNNAGTILTSDFSAGSTDGLGAGILFQATSSELGKIGTLSNSGSISGGHGIIYGGSLASSSIANSGSITGRQNAGVINMGTGTVSIDNQAGGTISGARVGVLARVGAVTVTNAGMITGNGGGNNGAIVIEAVGSSINNSGLIQGSNFGITANAYFNSVTGLNEGRAIGTVVTNSGTIRGQNNDAIRLQGGGTVTNSGLIEGVSGNGTDGISMFSHAGQDVSGITSIGTVNNEATGSIRGNRFGIILSNGGVVNNAGSIWASDFTPGTLDGYGTGVVVQDGVGGSNKIGTIANTGTISGGVGLAFAGTMASGSLTNSGTITGRQGDGLKTFGTASVAVNNQAGGTITGARSGIFSEYSVLTLNNAGTIRGNGSNANFNRTDAGVVIIQPGSSVTNSGTISGAKFGLTTTYLVESGVFKGLALGTSVTNSGTIRGDANDGVRLIGGGTVTNSGLIEGLVDTFADGISMFAFENQDTSALTGIGTVNNQAGGTIRGNRFGIILSGGGTVENAGSIIGPNNSAGEAVIGSGVSVQVLAANGNYRPSTTYTILTATNKITGTFASVSTDLAFLEPKLNQTSKYVELTIKRKSNTFASVAANPNQASVATAVESMGLYNSLYDSVLTQNLAGARAAFDSFSGDFFGTISNRVLGSAQGLQATLQADAQATPQGPAMWSMVEDGTRTGFTPEYRSGISMARNGFRAAMMTGYVPYERIAVGSEGNASMATNYVGGSVGYSADGWNLHAGAGYARHQIQASRLIAFSDFADGSQTRYSATTQQLFGEVSYSFNAAGLALTPFASASRLSMSGTQIDEIGGDAALSITSAARTLNLASTGFRAVGSYDLGKGLRLNPKLALSWQWAGGDLGTWQQSRFKGNGARFDINAAQVSGSGLNVDAGLELAFGRMSLAAEYRRNEVLRHVGDGAHLTFRTVF